MARIRVLVVDDHRIFAESLAAALAAEQDVDVSAAGSGPAALRALERAAVEGRRYDVLLIDADLGAVAVEAARARSSGGRPAGRARGRTAVAWWTASRWWPGCARATPGVRTVVLAERDDPRRGGPPRCRPAPAAGSPRTVRSRACSR
ncbi:hypothetical protein GCM10020221_01060 [Streptomyces thioluteus]|uniref:Response regulatory domain-containing protein n=1 Tax=Streptomyces thioluteus TaxID=66431 RepID=A0ABN3WAV3_STRTU